MTEELVVEASAAEGAIAPIPEAAIEAAVRLVLREEGVQRAEISIALVSDAEISRLNGEYLAHEGPTDVISFPLHAPGGDPLGDIYIGVDQARRQAEEMRVPLAEEVLRLAVHGTLHVLGYDHPEGAGREASLMYRRQEELLAAVLSRGSEPR